MTKDDKRKKSEWREDGRKTIKKIKNVTKKKNEGRQKRRKERKKWE